jgi:O-acetyl-ADP-ribose deacetylase (regulator of RNase III)
MTARITVMVGNITRQSDCDGIVNSANEYLIAGGGVCGAIHEAAGPELEAYGRRHAPLALGEAIATPAFRLTARYVIHVRGPKFLQDPDPGGNLARALRSALWLADQNGIECLAVPAISMGVYGYPADQAVPILVDTAKSLLARLKTLREIRFVVTSAALAKTFQDAIRDADEA